MVLIKRYIFMENHLCIKDTLNFLLLTYNSEYQKALIHTCSTMNWLLYLKIRVKYIMCIKYVTFCYFSL